MLKSQVSSDSSTVRVKIFYTGFGSSNSATFNALVALHLAKLTKEVSECCEDVCTITIGRPNLQSEILAQGATGVYCCCRADIRDECHVLAEQEGIPFHTEVLAEETLSDVFCGC